MARTGRFVAFAISTLVTTAISAPATANLIVNGSFEIPGGGAYLGAGSTFIEGWVVTRDDVELSGGCSDGQWCLDLDGSDFRLGRCAAAAGLRSGEHRVLAAGR